MNINITARKFTISEDLTEFIKDKLSKISKYDNQIDLIDVILLKESRAEKVEIIATSKNNSYITKCYSSAFEKTILMAFNNLKIQVLKSKKKH